MIKKLILILLSIHFYNQTCIDKDVLLRMGLKPAETQKIESPEVCKKVLKVASSCVDVDDLEIYLKDYQEYQNKLAEEGYKKLEDTTEYLEEKYKSLETDPESAVAFTGETITAEIQSKLDGLKELAGDADENLDTDKERNDCMEATNRVAMGALCILISDKASEFVKEVENFVGGAATLTPLEGDARFAFNLVNPVSLKVNENSADEVVNKCAVTIRKACFQKKMNEINDELDGIENDEVDDEACLAAVCTENNSCSALAKSNMFQNKFGPKGNRNIDGDESEMSEKRKALNDELKKKIEEKLGDKGTQLTELREKLFTLKNELNAGDKTNKDEFEKLKAEYKILNDELKPIIKSARKEFHDANKTARDALKEERKKNQEQEKKEKPPLDDATKAILETYKEDLKDFNDTTKALRKELNLKVQAEMEAINADTALTEAQKLEKIEAKKTELKTALEKEIAALKKALEDKTGLEDIKWKNKQKELKEKKEKTDEQKPKEGDKPAPKEETAARLGLNAVTTGGATFSYVVDNSGADVVAEAEELGVSTSGVDFSKLFAVIAFITLF